MKAETRASPADMEYCTVPSGSPNPSKVPTESRLGRFELRAEERRLLEGGKPVKLSSRAFDLLCVLLDRRDRVVSKSELLDLVWPSLVVEENNLEVHISALRKLLGSEAIATVSGRGYRFTGIVDGSSKPRASPNNIPNETTRFIGRTESLTNCAALLQTTRILTLRGIGGGGKTRLALKLAQSVAPDFPDGVWFVDLAPIQDGERVALAVADALKLGSPADRSLNEHISACLGARRVLVVLDNCEQVVEHVVEIARILISACPSLKIVATSREVLGIEGEQVFSVGPMELPRSDDVNAVLQSEAVQLFLDRARQVGATVDNDDESVCLAAETCRRLDGIPLAIELAAARLKVVTIGQLLHLLGDRFGLLTGSARLPTRQRTLETVVQWSYQHLNGPEQRMYRRLAVFAGGCGLDAAFRGSNSGREEIQVIDLLGRLVDKSLLTMTPTSEGARYTMLETLRQHALELLEDSPQEAVEARLEHLQVCVDIAESRTDLSLTGKAIWLHRLDTERENVLAAHRWCVCAGAEASELNLRLFVAMQPYWIARGLLELGRSTGGAALMLPGVQEPSLLRVSALLAVGQLACFSGHFDEAQRYCEEGLSLARRHGNTSEVAEALLELGHIAEGFGDPVQATRLYHDALAAAREAQSGWWEAGALASLAELQRVAGDLARAESLYEESSALRRQYGDVDLAGFLNRAMIALEKGAWGRSRALALEAVPLIRQTEDRSFGSALLDVATGLASVSGAWRTAARFHGASEGQHALMAARREPTDEAFVQPMVMKARLALGAGPFEEAQSEGRDLGFESALGEVQSWLEEGAALL